jgi:hypothetical protein
MIGTCAGIDKYAFYLDFKGVLSSKPQVSVDQGTQLVIPEIPNYYQEEKYFSGINIYGYIAR